MQKKDIINLKDGKLIGRIVDVEVDMSSGYLIKFIIETPGLIRNIFSNQSTLTIKFNQIKKLGEDVILIDISN